MGKSQETPQLAVGMNGRRGFGGGSPHYGFFLGRCPAACCGVLHFSCIWKQDGMHVGEFMVVGAKDRADILQ